MSKTTKKKVTNRGKSVSSRSHSSSFIALFFLFATMSIILVIASLFSMMKTNHFYEELGSGYSVEVIESSYLTAYDALASDGAVGLEIIQPCNYVMTEDWNLFSMCAHPYNYSVEHVLSAIDDHYRFLLEWDYDTQEFQVYSKLALNKPFTEMNTSKSYFVYLDSSQRFSMAGNEFADLYLDLPEKWSTPTYPYIYDGNMTKYIDTLGEDYYFYMLWNRPEQLFDVVSRLAIDKPVTIIPAGHGQFIYITNPAGSQLRYNKSGVMI